MVLPTTKAADLRRMRHMAATFLFGRDGGSSSPLPPSVELVTQPSEFFTDDFVRANTTSPSIGTDWTVEDGNDVRIESNRLIADFPGSTTEHFTAFWNGNTAITDGFLAVIRPTEDVGEADQQTPTFGLLWYWDGNPQDSGPSMNAYVCRRWMSGQDQWLQSIVGTTFTTFDSDTNVLENDGGYVLQVSFTDSDHKSKGFDDQGAAAAQASTAMTARTTGRVGLIARVTSGNSDPQAVLFTGFVYTNDNSLVMEDLPTGWKIRSKSFPSIDFTESGGVATMDCYRIPVDGTDGYDEIEVLDDLDAVQASFNKAASPNGKILPGATFRYTG